MAFFNILKKISEGIEDNVAIEDAERQITYRQFLNDIDKMTIYFASCEEKRIALIGATSYEWLCFAYGAISAGKTVVAIDELLPRQEIVSLLDYSDSQVAYLDTEDKKLRTLIEEIHIEYKLMDMDVSGSVVPMNSDKYQEGDILFFTSGTSGKAKGVVIPFGAVYRNAQRLSEYVAEGFMGKGYVPMPTGHIYANAMILTFLYQRRTICLGNPRRMMSDIEFFKPTVLAIVPSMAEYLLDSECIETNIKVITVAGAKCDLNIETKAKAKGIILQSLYGTSETAGAIAMNRLGYSIDHMLPLRDIKVSIETTEEIVIENKDVMREYYNKSEETSRVLRQGCVYIGDRGKENADGTFAPLGRIQDMIAMKNGNKLYCLEIDEELSAIEGVDEACIIYVNDKIIAVIVAKETLRTDIDKYLKVYNKKQPYFRKIEEVWYRDAALPRTSIGKLKRNIVAEEYLKKD